MVSFADAARARNRTVLPEELLRAWEPPAAERHLNTERHVDRSDEFAGAHAPGGKSGGRGRRLAIGAAALVVVVAGSVTAVVLTHHSSPSKSATQAQTKTHQTSPPVSPPGAQHSAPAARHYSADGMPFSAVFPRTPKVSHSHLSVLNHPITSVSYTASAGGTTESVGVFPLPIGNPLSFNLRRFARAFLGVSGTAPAGTTLSAGAESRIQGLATVMVAATSAGGQWATFGAIVFDGHVAYEVLATGPSTKVDAAFHSLMTHFRVSHPALGFSF
jgi:hypothetical protein